MAKSEVTERQIRAVGLRRAGLGYTEIASAVGYANRGSAWKAVHRALRGELREEVAALVTLELHRLDQMTLGLWPRATRGDVGAIDRVLRIMERRASLLGLDSPRKIKATGSKGGPIRHEVDLTTPDYSALSMQEQYSLDRLLAKLLGQADAPFAGMDPS
jgi:hypothetical protein